MTQAASTPIRPAVHRLRRALWVLAGLGVALATILGHGAWARSQRARALHPEMAVLPSPALVLSTRSRWLRHPLMSEPGAAFQDAPAFLDADPAGALHTPPRALFHHTETRP